MPRARKLLRINVFSATFLPDAYLPDFYSCTKHIDFAKLKQGLPFLQSDIGNQYTNSCFSVAVPSHF